ncbi:MAG: hypothetical protein AB7S26_05855 [Sandaracinaceae bacterium]
MNRARIVALSSALALIAIPSLGLAQTAPIPPTPPTPPAALADDGDRGHDAVSFGESVHVAAGRTVHDAVSFGGDTLVEGVVLGDAVSFGGDVILRDGAEVHGDIVTMGGTVHDERDPAPAARPAETRPTPPATHPPARHHAHHREPRESGFAAWLREATRSAMAHVLLFVLGLLMIGVWRERLGAMQVTMIRDGLKTAGTGLIGYVAAVVGIVVLCITLVGIPAAVIAAVALPVATYVGLAAAATVLGAALPVPKLNGNEIAQLGAGVLVLFLCSLVPVVGKIAVAVAACLGLGALIRTRLKPTPPEDLPRGEGPYRTPSPADV